jgi:hypothetical protein
MCSMLLTTESSSHMDFKVIHLNTHLSERKREREKRESESETTTLNERERERRRRERENEKRENEMCCRVMFFYSIKYNGGLLKNGKRFLYGNIMKTCGSRPPK